MSQMRAVLVKDGKGPVENLYIGTTALPTPSATQVLVKVRHTEAVILKVYQGYCKCAWMVEVEMAQAPTFLRCLSPATPNVYLLSWLRPVKQRERVVSE